MKAQQQQMWAILGQKEQMPERGGRHSSSQEPAVTRALEAEPHWVTPGASGEGRK